MVEEDNEDEDGLEPVVEDEMEFDEDEEQGMVLASE